MCIIILIKFTSSYKLEVKISQMQTFFLNKYLTAVNVLKVYTEKSCFLKGESGFFPKGMKMGNLPLVKLIAYWVIFHDFLSSADFFRKNSLRNTILMSYNLDPDQAQRFIGPDLGSNCLPRLSADDTGKQ